MHQLELLEALINRGLIQVSVEGLSALELPSAGFPVHRDRIEGMLLGLAIGDALGNTTESQVPAERRARYGEIRDYLPNRYAGGRSVGLPSDDTQLTFWTLESLLEHGQVVPEALAARFASRRIFGIGHAVAAFAAAHRNGAPWYQAAQGSAGNGAMMRIAPVVLPHLGKPSRQLWADAVLAGAVTHNDPTSIGACVALVGILWEVLAMPHPPEPAWWLDTYCGRACLIEGNVMLDPRHPRLAFRGPAWRLVDTEVRRALVEEVPVLEACERWYSGAFLLETVPSALYLLARHGHDPEQALIRAINDTRDNDTIAAIVGAVLGALHGRSALPKRWVTGLLGRTAEDDDGRIFALIEQAVARFALHQ